jgi:IS30 family transposase
LPHKEKHHFSLEKRGKFAVGLSISDRSREVKGRQIVGHWELDSMVSNRGKNKGCFAAFVERKTYLYTVLKMSDRIAPSMQKAIEVFLHELSHFT